MPHPVYVPCVNINDEIVQIVDLAITAGKPVRTGDVIAEVETDKAVIPVEAEQDGYVLKILCNIDDRVRVGSVMMWIGDSPDEVVPEPASEEAEKERTATTGALKPTAKARALLEQYKLDAEDIPHQGERLTAADVESFIAGQKGTMAAPGVVPVPDRQERVEPMPATPGRLQPLSAGEQGMVSTVTWHRDHAVSAYLEMAYDTRPWEEYAAAFADRHRFMFSPLLPLMAYRLIEIARDMPRINSTIVGDQRYHYDQVNLGFTVQVEETLYLTVVQRADGMYERRFVDALGEVQRHAIARKLGPDESQGSTVGFSSMARWAVNRHVPVLAPYTSLMVAHAAPERTNGAAAVLGASYDHRVLSGFDVVRVLQQLIQPPERTTS